MNLDLGPLETDLHRVARLRRLPDPETRQLIRERAGVSITAIARCVGVDPSTAHGWDKGKHTPRGRHLEDYIIVLARLAEFGALNSPSPETAEAAF